MKRSWHSQQEDILKIGANKVVVIDGCMNVLTKIIIKKYVLCYTCYYY